MQADQRRWNERYEAQTACDPEEPSGIVQQFVGPSSGKALDLACGLGRHAIHLARAGFDVTAIDVSDVGLKHAKKRAVEARVTIEWIHADLDTFVFPLDCYDLITCINFLDRKLIAQLPNMVKVGGVVIYQALIQEPEEITGGNIPFLFRAAPNELLRLFLRPDLRILAYSEQQDGDKSFATLIGKRLARTVA